LRVKVIHQSLMDNYCDHWTTADEVAWVDDAGLTMTDQQRWQWRWWWWLWQCYYYCYNYYF